MSKFYKCVYCGEKKLSGNGTGSDISCCKEVGHVEEVRMCPRCDDEHCPDGCRDPLCPSEQELIVQDAAR